MNRAALALALLSTVFSQGALAQDPARREPRRQPVTPELERTAFRDAHARTLLERARAARVSQDRALGAYDANTYLRVSVGLGVRRLGVERLFFRTEQAARVQWARGTGLWVQPTGRRTAFPMGKAEVDFAPATPIPFFPGRESLWFPGGGVAQAEVDENELLHPLALGAEAYYRYATGDSTTIRLPDGRAIALRELRITARRPEWRAFVGSFWFDVDRGSLVRAAYRMAAEMDIWQVSNEEARQKLEELEARARSDTGTVLDSVRAEIREERGELRETRVAKTLFSPMRASITAITVEYGLHQGRFWLPRLNVAEGEVVAAMMRIPMKVEERFTYKSVTIDTSGVISATVAAASDTTSPAYLAQRDSGYISGGYATMNLGSGQGARTSQPVNEDSLYRAWTKRADSLRAEADSLRAKGKLDEARFMQQRSERRAAMARGIVRRREGCARDSTYYAGSTSRYDGALRIAIRMPCDTTRFATSPDLPPSIYDEGERVFGESERDALIDALDMNLQPGWLPQPPVFHTGFDMLRYNRIEGLSLGASVSSALGRGYTARAEARLGVADLVPNGELMVTRSNGRDEIRLTGFHRLSVANDDFGAPLSFGASIGNLIDAGDEGFYYRSWGAELSGTRRAPLFGVPMEWRLFAEAQRSAGIDPNTQISLGDLFANPRFRANIDAIRLTAGGARVALARSFGVNPLATRFDARLRLEGAATDRSDMASVTGYGRYVADATLSFPFGPFSWAFTGAGGFSTGDLPVQRAFFMGGLHTVRGQVAKLDGEGRVGNAFWLSRTELGVTRSLAFKPTLFYDIGWAGSRTDVTLDRPLSGAGLGFSLMDGLLRIDVARGIWPERRWRTHFYMGSPF